MAAIEQGDVPQTRKLLFRCPASYERVAAQLLFDYSSPLGRREPPFLLLELYDRARLAGVSLIDAYAQAPEELEQIGRYAKPSVDQTDPTSRAHRHA